MRETDLSQKDLRVFEYILKNGKDIVSLHFLDQKKRSIAATPPKSHPWSTKKKNHAN